MVAEVKTMEIKKVQENAALHSYSGKQAENFISEIKSEVKKITWTKRDELFFYAKVVILSTFLFGLSIFGLDLLIQNILNALNVLLRLISG